MPTIELRKYTERALKRISPVYEKSLFMKSFFNGVGMSYDLLREYFTTLANQNFIDTVDWGIAFQELKYSLDIREDLTLEERRARLGLKTQIRRPLNPARLEKYIRESFGLDVYLYEKDAGYIRIYSELFTQDGYKKMLEWLQVEKPAHLMLSTCLNMTEYIGGEGKASRVVASPDVPIELPKTIAEKKKFPRLFAGVGQYVTGLERVDLKRPESPVVKLRAGLAQGITGEVFVASKQLKHSQITLRAGICQLVVGRIWIDSYEKPTLPYYPFRLEPPYEPDNSHDFYYDMIDKAGIYIKEEVQPPLRMRSLKAPAQVQEVFYTDFNYLPEDKLPKMFEWRNIVENPYADIGSVNMAVARGDYTFEDVVIDTDEWDVVKIFFGFSMSRHRRYRGVAMPNPRADLTKEEIKEAGQYAVDNQLIKNARGEFANRVLGAAYKRREVTEIQLGIRN